MQQLVHYLTLLGCNILYNSDKELYRRFTQIFLLSLHLNKLEAAQQLEMTIF